MRRRGRLSEELRTSPIIVPVWWWSVVDQFFRVTKSIRDVEILKHLDVIVNPLFILGGNGFYPNFLEIIVQFGRKPFHDIFHTSQWVVTKLEVRQM